MKRITIFIVCLSFLGFNAFAQDIQITGKVTSAEDGSSLPGVSVTVKGTTTGTSTNIDGDYSLSAPSDATLVYSFVGMQTQEVPVGGQTTINVALDVESTTLDEIVVVGYGTKAKGSVTGSVGLVKAEEIEQSAIASFDQALQGKVTGVQVLNSSGRPGAEAIVRIRGISTVNATTDPLYIIDGVPVRSDDFAALNPNDIESISVLKDALASIYGSQAANGVIFITTKRGRTNQSRIDYRFYTGWSQMAKKDMNMMNAEEKIQYEIDAGWRVGADADPAVVDSLINQSHDWVETIGRTARTNSHELSFSGGSEKTTYFISGNMYNQEGLVEGSFLDRITGRVNVAHKFSDRLDVGVNMTVGYYKRGGVRDRRNVQNPFYAMLIYNPYEALKLPDGEWNYTHEGFNIVEALEKNPERLQQFKSIGNFYLNWEFVKGLTFSTLAGMDLMDDTRQTFTMPSSILASYVGDAMRDQFRRRFRQNYTNYLTYKNRFDVHGITLKAGIDAQKYYYRSTLLAVQGFPSDKLAVPDAAASPTDAGGTIDEWGLFAYFGTLTYDFNQKYIIDLIGRRDASSRFGENNKWANFGAVGASWNLHEESFMESLTFLSILKLRASYGTTGNFRYIDNTGLEPYYEWMGTYSYYQYNGLSASYPGKIENPDLKWEVVKSFDAGFDFSLYNERIRGTFDYYNKKTEDLFFPRQVSRTSGFTERIENVGSMVNQGIEFGLEGDVVRTGDLIWTIGADITTLKNEITELYGEDDTQIEDGFGILKVGEPVYQFFLVRYAGVNPANGDALFYDVDGNITNVYSDADRVILDKSPLPKFYGSFYTNLSYKGIDLSALFYYNYGNHIFSYFVYQSESDGTNITDNQSRVMLDAWKQPGDITDVPETRVGNDRAYLTDRNLENGNYLRLREVTLAYNLPKSLISKIKMRSLRVYVKGTNLFTITAYKGFDPEIGYNSSETDATPVGSFDENTYPASRTFSFGIDVGF